MLSNPSIDLEEKRTEQVAKIGENIQISRSEALSPKASGLVESYVHTGAKVAVLLSIGSESADASVNDDVVTMAKDICMHIGATSPVCVTREEVPTELVQKRRKLPLLKQKESLLRQLKKLLPESLKSTIRSLFARTTFCQKS